jgi:hypothetical protein
VAWWPGSPMAWLLGGQVACGPVACWPGVWWPGGGERLCLIGVFLNWVPVESLLAFKKGPIERL